MKKIIIILITVVFISGMMSSCASDKVIQGVVVEPYGLFNKEIKKSDINYDLNVWSVVFSVIFVETVVVPVIILGLYLYEPVGPKLVEAVDPITRL